MLVVESFAGGKVLVKKGNGQNENIKLTQNNLVDITLVFLCIYLIHVAIKLVLITP